MIFYIYRELTEQMKVDLKTAIEENILLREKGQLLEIQLRDAPKPPVLTYLLDLSISNSHLSNMFSL